MKQEFYILLSPDTLNGIPETHEIDCSVIRQDILNVEFTSKRFKDFEWTQYSHCLIKENVAKLMEKEEFSGYVLKPIKSRMRVRDYNIDYDMEDIENPGIHPIQEIGLKIPAYYELAVTGWGGLVKPDAGIKRIPGTDKWQEDNFVWEKAIDEKQWDGSDFFFIWPFPGYKIITNRVAEFLKKNKYKGFRIIKLSDFSKNIYSNLLGRVNPGKLRQSLDEERAHKYGDPYDIY